MFVLQNMHKACNAKPISIFFFIILFFSLSYKQNKALPSQAVPVMSY